MWWCIFLVKIKFECQTMKELRLRLQTRDIPSRNYYSSLETFRFPRSVRSQILQPSQFITTTSSSYLITRLQFHETPISFSLLQFFSIFLSNNNFPFQLDKRVGWNFRFTYFLDKNIYAKLVRIIVINTKWYK